MQSLLDRYEGHGSQSRAARSADSAAASGRSAVRIHATALNRGELIVGSAVHGGAEELGGTEASGVVEAVGEGVSEWKKGDRVMGRRAGALRRIRRHVRGTSDARACPV